MKRFFQAGVILGITLLISGCGGAIMPTSTPTPTQTLTPTVVAVTLTPFPSRTPLPSVTPLGGVASATAPRPPQPTSTSALIALATVTAEAANQRPLTPTFTPTGSGLQPGVPPPLTIKLPEGWRTTYTLVPFNDLTGTSSTLNLAAYAGSVSGGSGLGFIYILWNFPSVMPVNPRALPTSIADAQTATTLSDGYRLLRGTILDSTCLVNVYGQNYFGIGERKTIGQIFQTTACQDGRPDLVGWYTGVWEGNRHYLVFAWVEPPVAFNNGQADLQKILNTIQFVPVTPIPTPPPTTQPPPPTATPTLELS